MPAVNFAERASDERRGDYTSVDKYVINLERIRTPVVAGGVERADLAGEVSLETAYAREQASQRGEECHVERHQKMPSRHEQRADCDCACASKHTVRDQSATDRREINEPGVESENRRCERLHGERTAIDDLEQVAKWTKPGDAVDMSGVQQSVDHVKDKERLHAVVGKAFPSFREREIAKTAWMPDEATILRLMHGRRVLPPTLFGKRSPSSDFRAVSVDKQLVRHLASSSILSHFVRLQACRPSQARRLSTSSDQLHNRAAAARPCTCSAAEAMIAGHNFPVADFVWIDIP
jgi:hypothetical protein